MGRARPWRSGMLLAAAALLLAYGLAVIGSGFDRLTQRHAPSERFVPGPFRSHAAVAAMTIAFARQDFPNALASAKAAVRREPNDRQALGGLGSARLLTGDALGARTAFRVAARTGWRDLPTQLYWYDAALRSGDLAGATARPDANPQFAQADALLMPIEALPAGRAALAERLAIRPNWLNRYLSRQAGPEVETLVRRADVATRIGARGVRLGCDRAALLATPLLASGLRQQAEGIWRMHCNDLKLSGGVVDPDFSLLANGQPAQPFGWRRYSSGDVLVAMAVAPDGGHALTMHNRASVSHRVLSQAVHLEPGRYRLQLGLPSGNRVSAAAGLAAALTCGAGQKRPAPDAGPILVIGACEQQFFSLWLSPHTAEIVISSVNLEELD